MVPDTEMSIAAIFYNLAINHFLHRLRGENVICKAYFSEIGQSECVYFS